MKILDGDSIDKIVEAKKVDQLVQVITGNNYTLLVNYTTSQLTSLLQLLKEKEVPTCSLIEDEKNLIMLKYVDVGVAVNAIDQPYLDRHRYCDIKVASVRQFLKLLFLHSRVPPTIIVEQLHGYIQTADVPHREVLYAVLF